MDDHFHCRSCYRMQCAAVCPIVECHECCARMHECKTEDHALICPSAIVSCINPTCPHTMRRNRIGIHLEHCPASVVVCSAHRVRACYSEDDRAARWELKKLARGQNTKIVVENDEDIDVASALYDQQIIVDSYRHSRAEHMHQCRVRAGIGWDVERRQSLGRHPLLPMIGHEIATNSDNSIDEESVPTVERSVNSPANDCVICQSGDYGQHLHVFGNREKFRQKPVVTIREPPQRSQFHKDHNLFVNLTPNLWTSSRVAPGGVYTIECGKTVRRDGLGDHHESHHSDISSPDNLIQRCPRWSAGCNFKISRLHPLHGRTAWNSTLCCVTVKSIDVAQPCTDDVMSHLMSDVCAEIIAHLDGGSLYCLSLVNRHWRRQCEAHVELLGIVDRPWMKCDDGQWVEGGTSWSYPRTTSTLANSKWEPSGDNMTEHMKKCCHTTKSVGKVLVMFGMDDAVDTVVI